MSDQHKSDLQAAHRDQDSQDLDESEEPIEDQTVKAVQEESEGGNEVDDGGGSGDSMLSVSRTMTMARRGIWNMIFYSYNKTI